MGVDLSIGVEVGFVIDPDKLNAWMREHDLEDDTDEALCELIHDEPLLCYGSGGSYYVETPTQSWVSVRRLSIGGDSRSVDGGVYGVARTVITLAEREALQRVAFKLEHPFTDAYQFVYVLWH